MKLKVRKNKLLYICAILIFLILCISLLFFAVSSGSAPGDLLILLDLFRDFEIINFIYTPVEPIYLLLYHFFFSYLIDGNLIFLGFLFSSVYILSFLNYFAYLYRLYLVEFRFAFILSAIYILVLQASYLPFSISLQLLRQALSSVLLVFSIMPTSSYLFSSVRIPFLIATFFKVKPYSLLSPIFIRYLVLFLSLMFHFSSFFFIPLSLILILFAECKINIQRAYIFLSAMMVLSSFLISSSSMRLLANLYSLVLGGSSVVSDKVELYINSYYTSVQYPSVSYRGVLVILFLAFVISLSIERRIQATLVIPVFAVFLSICYPQGTVLSHRFYQSARLFSIIPLSIVLSYFFSYIFNVRKRIVPWGCNL